jgi:hypothetical protein
MTKPIKWLYLTKDNSEPFSEEFLNKLGSDGWELMVIHVVNPGIYESFHYIFKRQII